ncbi:hypothetical protein JW948_14520 [bacterium]|nr:hypothetical protein [bacterium]
MNDLNGDIPRHMDIPRLFYSDASGSPFEHCIQCQRRLFDTNSHYLIEKAIKSYPDYGSTDTVFEYAICISCYMDLRKSLSAESSGNMEAYFHRHTDLLERRKMLLANETLDYHEWIASCVFKNTPASRCKEYQVVCECQGDQMLFTLMPYMVCGEAMDEMMDLLSNQTIDFLNGFRDRFLGPSPEIRDLLKPSRIMIL